MASDDDLVERALRCSRLAFALAVLSWATLLLGAGLALWGTPPDEVGRFSGLVIPVPRVLSLSIGAALATGCAVGSAVLAATDVAILRQVQTLDRARTMVDRLRGRTGS